MSTQSAGTTTRANNPIAAKLTISTLVVMNITAVVSLRFLPSEAEYGLSSIFYYLFAAIFFLAPVCFVAAELATGWPEKGGAFRWVGEAFGARFGFLAMSMLWIQVMTYFPTVLTFGAVSLAFIDPNQSFAETISANKLYILAVVLVAYWGSTLIALRGVEAFSKVSKWCGIIGTIIPAIVVIVLGFAYVLSGQAPQVALTWGGVIPDFTNFTNVVLAVSIFLAYAGMEMNAVHVKDISNPTRNYPIAIIIASIGTVAIFVLSTLAIAFVIPSSQINLTQSLLVAYNDLFRWAGIEWAGSIIAVMLALGVLGGVVTWIAGPNSGLLEVARAGYLPRWFQKVNQNGMGTHILLVQAVVVTLLSILFVVLPSVQATFQILSQLTVILYLVMYVLMFAAGIRLRFSQPNRPRPYRIPGGNAGMVILGGMGLVGSVLAFVFSFIPPSQIAIGSPTVYVSVLVVLTLLFVAAPLVVFALRKPTWRDPNTDFAPFTWEEQQPAGQVNPK